MKLFARVAAAVVVTGLFGLSGAALSAQAAPHSWCVYQAADGSCLPTPSR
jgi:hypothetical protein